MEKQDLTVADIMTPEVTSVQSGTNFIDLMDIFQTTRYHFLPVLTPTGQVMGLVNKADYYQMLYSFDIYGTSDNIPNLEDQMREISVERVMRTQLILVEKSLPFNTAVSYLRADIKNALLVVEHNRLIGIVTIHDLFNQIYGLINAYRNA